MMNIINLAEAPEHISQIAAWHHAEWGYLNPGGTVETRIERMKRYLSGAKIPAMYIAVDGSALMGTAALVESDMDSHTELSPWLASVFVNPDYRQRGVGAALVKKVMEEARIQGISPLYLFTPDQQRFYESLGWEFIAHENYRGGNATLMKIHF